MLTSGTLPSLPPRGFEATDGPPASFRRAAVPVSCAVFQKLRSRGSEHQHVDQPQARERAPIGPSTTPRSRARPGAVRSCAEPGEKRTGPSAKSMINPRPIRRSRRDRTRHQRDDPQHQGGDCASFAALDAERSGRTPLGASRRDTPSGARRRTIPAHGRAISTRADTGCAGRPRADTTARRPEPPSWLGGLFRLGTRGVSSSATKSPVRWFAA